MNDGDNHSDNRNDSGEAAVWAEVDAFLDEHRSDYNMSFGLEYSSTVDWCADFTPRRNHPQAREYGLWQGQASSRKDAIRKALVVARNGIAQHEQILNDIAA